MDDNPTRILKMFKEIKESPFGTDFIEYLNLLSHENYMAFKSDPAEFNDIHKGYAQAVDNLVELFSKCDNKHGEVAENKIF